MRQRYGVFGWARMLPGPGLGEAPNQRFGSAERYSETWLAYAHFQSHIRSYSYCVP